MDGGAERPTDPDPDGADDGRAPQEPAARGPRKPRWPVVVLVAVLCCYVAVLALYSASGRNQSYHPTGSEPADGVDVSIALGDLDAAGNRQHADVTIVPGSGLLSSDGVTPSADIDLVLVPTSGQQQLHFPAGQVPATVPVQLLVDGDIENWPFDRYQGVLLLQAKRVAAGVSSDLPFTVSVDGSVKGWKTAVAPVSAAPASSTDLQVFDYDARRAGGTLGFGLVMVAVLITLPVLSLFATSEVLRGRRKVEPAFAGWIAAMLFAVVPLRNFLPGSPPPGSWIDVTVVLWVLVGLVLSLVLYVVAWWRHGRPHAD